jgi:hypothetical protein
MMEKDLRRLSRRELLTLLTKTTKENDELKRQLREKNRMLNAREIVIDNAGSLAEAALQLNGIFEAAQKVADTYITNVKIMAKASQVNSHEY